MLNLFWTFCYYLGGQDVVGTQKTAEMIYLNGSRTEGPMPDNGRYGHCMVEYAGIIILMGGGYTQYLLSSSSHSKSRMLCFEYSVF